MSHSLNAEHVLRTLTRIRRSIPHRGTIPPHAPQSDARAATTATSLTDFELQAIADAMESVLNDLTSILERAHEHAREEGLRVYYTAEELSRDPAHADLLPHVEKMREAYERSYGVPIPARRD